MIQFQRKGNLRAFSGNLFLLASAWSCAFLCVTSLKSAVIALIWCIVTAFASFHLSISKDEQKNRGGIRASIASLLLVLMMGYYHYSAMIYSSKLKMVSAKIGISNRLVVLPITMLLAILALRFVLVVLQYLSEDNVVNKLSKIIESKYLCCVIYALSAIGLFLAVYYSFNGYIWADEAYSLRIGDYSFSDIIAMCAGDVHPPLYYLALKVVENIGSLFFDGYYWPVVIGKLFSVVPYMILAFLCWRFFGEEKKNRPYVLLCIFGMPQLLHYSVEIRMYSWALLFVTLSFLYAREIISDRGTIRNWIGLVVSSILSAYLHDFALVAMATIWLYLLIWIFCYNRELMVKWILFGLMVAICFSPWLVVLLKQMSYVSDSYWIKPITISSIISYFRFMFEGLAGLFPLIFVLGISTPPPEKRNNRKVFEDSIGFLVPMTTMFVGIMVSFAVRPIFVARYIVPTLLCMWISFILLLRHSSKRTEILFVVVLVLVSLNSYVEFIEEEHSTKVYARENVELFDRMEGNAVIIVSNDSHVSDTVSQYTPNMVYGWNAVDPSLFQTSKFREAFINEGILNDPNTIARWLDENRAIYYIEVQGSDPKDMISETDIWSLDAIGNYHMANKQTATYKIIKK